MNQNQLSDDIDYDYERIKPQPLLLNRCGLSNTIGQLTPLIDKFKWSNKKEKFCALWNFYAGNSKKLNTLFLSNNKMKIPKSILKYLIQEEQYKVRDIHMKDMPTEGSAKIIFEYFRSCFYSDQKPAKEKRPMDCAGPVCKAALREKKELINSLQKSRNPYEIESLKEKLKILKQAEKRKYRTMPYPERLFKQRKLYEQVPKTSKESLVRSAQAKSKKSSPQTSKSSLQRRVHAKSKRSSPQTSKESLEKCAQAKSKKSSTQTSKESLQRRVHSKSKSRLPKRSTANLQRRAYTKPKRSSPKTSTENLKRRAYAKPKVNSSKTSTQTVKKKSQAKFKRKLQHPEKHRQQQTKPDIDGEEYTEQLKEENVKQMEPEQMQLATLEDSPGIVNQRPSQDEEQLEPRKDSKETESLGNVSKGRKSENSRSERKPRASRKNPTNRKISRCKKALRARINESDVKGTVEQIYEIDDILRMEQMNQIISKAPEIKSELKGAESSTSQLENNMEMARAESLSHSDIEAIEQEKSHECYSYTSLNLKDYLSQTSTNLKIYIKKRKRTVAPTIVVTQVTDSGNQLKVKSVSGKGFSQALDDMPFIDFPLLSMERKVRYQNPYAHGTSEHLIMDPFEEMAKDGTKNQPIDLVKAQTKSQQENRNKSQLKVQPSGEPMMNVPADKEWPKRESTKQTRYAVNLIKKSISLRLPHSNDLKSRSVTPKPAKDEPINEPYNFSSWFQNEPQETNKKPSYRKTLKQIINGSSVRLSSDPWIKTDGRFGLPGMAEMAEKTNQKVNTQEEKSTPLLLADLMQKDKYLANTLKQAYSNLLSDTSSQEKLPVKTTSPKVQYNAETKDKLVDKPLASKCTLCEVCAKLSPFPSNVPTLPYMPNIQQKCYTMALRR